MLLQIIINDKKIIKKDILRANSSLIVVHERVTGEMNSKETSCDHFSLLRETCNILTGQPFKAAKYEIQRPSTCRTTLFCCKFWVNIWHFSPCVINLSRNKNICFGLKKVVGKSRTPFYFEQQILALLPIIFHQTLNLSCNKFAHVEGFVSRILPPLRRLKRVFCCCSVCEMMLGYTLRVLVTSYQLPWQCTRCTKTSTKFQLL